MRRLLGLTITPLLLCGGIYFFIKHPEHLDALRRLSLENLATLSLLMGLFFIVTGLTFNTLLSPFAVRLDIVETASLSFLSNLVSYLLPFRAGTGVKAIYLKRVKGLRYTDFGIATGANALLLAWVSGALGLVVLSHRWANGHGLPIPLMASSAAVFLSALLLFRIKLPQRISEFRIFSALKPMMAATVKLTSHPGCFTKTSAWIVLQFGLGALITSLIYQALDIPITFSMALVIGIFTTLANFFTVTPGNIGIQEVIMGALASYLGIPFGDGLIGASLLRALHIGVCVVFTPILLPILLRHSKTHLGDLIQRPKDATE